MLCWKVVLMSLPCVLYSAVYLNSFHPEGFADLFIKSNGTASKDIFEVGDSEKHIFSLI